MDTQHRQPAPSEGTQPLLLCPQLPASFRTPWESRAAPVSHRVEHPAAFPAVPAVPRHVQCSWDRAHTSPAECTICMAWRKLLLSPRANPCSKPGLYYTEGFVAAAALPAVQAVLPRRRSTCVGTREHTRRPLALWGIPAVPKLLRL